MSTTIAELERLTDIINIELGTPTKPWKRDGNGTLKGQPGNYYLSQAYGGYAMYQMQSVSGGVSDVFRSGHVTKREIALRMRAFLDGIRAAKEGKR